MLKVLVVDDDSSLRLAVSAALHSTYRFKVEEAADGIEAVGKIRNDKFDLVILDVDMPRLNGLEALKQMKELDPALIVIVLTAHASIDTAVLAVKEGAYNFVSKPLQGKELINLVDKALEDQKLINNALFSAPSLMDKPNGFIGQTVEMQKVYQLISRLSKVDTPVMIRGASGTGKELVARAIHLSSSRKNEKFVAINCSAIPENLFESELFGHEKGSFTGADARKIGKFQYAEGGTLFLDEIGDMPALMQVKLLRVLQEKKFVPVGANREIESNVRIIAATNRPLEEMIQKHEFREDLFYRLNVIPIFLPRLKDRKQDLDSLINHFLAKFNQIHARDVLGITSDALAALKAYDWPGNIRELENVMEHCFVMESSARITLHSLPEKLLENLGIDGDIAFDAEVDTEEAVKEENLDASLSASFQFGDKLDFNAHKEQFEKEFIIKALQTFKGRINQTALHANIPKKTLLRKIEKYGINPREYTNKVNPQ